MMTITVEIPDVLAGVLSAEGRDPARAVLEAMALEGYRADWLTEADLKELLGFETRMEVHRFLKDHGASMHYTAEDLDHDAAVAVDVARRHRGQDNILRRGDPRAVDARPSVHLQRRDDHSSRRARPCWSSTSR
jgi:Uncharacterised protein family (UPF0175)